MTPTDDPGIDPMEVWNGVLRDVREVTLRDSTVVVTHRLTATSGATVRFQILDPFPGEFDIDEVGFHPNFEPDHGRIGTDQAVITGVVEPGEELVIKYGIRPLPRPDTAAIQELQQRTKPSIEMSSKIEGTEIDDADLQTATMTRSSSEEAATGADTDDMFSDFRRRIADKEASAWGPDVADAAGLNEDSAEDPPESEPEVEEVEATEAPTDEAPSVDDLFDEDVDPRSDDSQEGPDSFGIQGGDPVGNSEINASFASSMASMENEEADADDDAADTATEPATTDDAEIVQVLIDQLEADRLTADQRRQLADRLGRLLQGPEKDRRSTDVRLSHLEGQLERFEAYADALEAVIDVHGPAEEFLSQVRNDITGIESTIEELEQNLEDASDDRGAQRKRLNEMADEVATLDSRLERLRDRLESVRSDHRRKTADLDERLTEIEPTVQKLDDLETDVASLRETMERLEARLNAVGDALAPQDSDWPLGQDNDDH